MPAGTTPQQRLNAMTSPPGGATTPVDANAAGVVASGAVLPRGKVMIGAASLQAAILARSVNARWSIQNGVVTLVSDTGYLPGDAIQINSSTGMIGVPKSTDNGITVRCQLNPLIKLGQLIQINQADITQSSVAGLQPGIDNQPTYYAPTSSDGFYRVVVAEHVGDLRSNDFYTDLVCLAVDRSNPSSPVLAAG